MNEAVRILFVEDEPVHYTMAVNIMKHEGLKFQPLLVDSMEKLEEALTGFNPRILITDYMLPGFTGMDVIRVAKTHDPRLPVIILTGAISEEVAVECMRAGASNYVLKNNLIRLPYSILEALRKHEALQREELAMQHLRESESRLNSIANSAGDGIIMLNDLGMITFWNPAAAEIFGYTREEALGMPLHDFLVPEEYRPLFHQNFPSFRKTGEGKALGKNNELTGLRKGGSLINISLTLSSVLLQGKWHAIGIVRDITEQKKVQQELTSAKERAEASDKLKTAFINNISHEVRTPLNGILGFTELLGQEGITPEEREQFRSLLKISSTRLLNTITNYMDISLLVSGNIVLRPRQFSLHSQLQSLYDLYKPLCKVKDLTLKLHIPEDIRDINLVSDREFHFKILSHLLDNAVKFTHSGTISFGYNLEKEGIHYFIADTGIGIQPDMHDRIFENFRQGEVAITRDYEGSGLGLSIASRFVELLGGHIELESSRGSGAVFSFLLHYEEAEICKDGTICNDQIPVPGNNRVILLAEDDVTNYLLQEKILKKAGFEVIPASDGREAVEQCRKNRHICAVLMDLKMPLLDGYEATRQIKKIRKNLPVIAVTAFAMSGDEKKAMEAGCDYYISKPLMEKAFLKALADVGVLKRQP